MLCGMRLLFSVLNDTLAIGTRNLTLVYIFFLMFLIASFILGQAGMPSLDPRWLTLIAVLGLILAAFMAGLLYMVSQACLYYLDNRQKGASPVNRQQAALQAFGNFRNFFPGVGAFFLPVTVGYAIQTGVLAALIFWTRPLWADAMPLFEKVRQTIVAGSSQEALIQSLTPDQQMAMAQFGLSVIGIGLIYGAFSLLVMLWPAFVVMYEENPLKAYGRSLVQFFRDPFRLIAIATLFFGARLLLAFLVNFGGILMEILGQLLMLLLELLTLVSIFVYSYHKIGRPTITAPEDNTSDAAGKPPATL
jgi:hypothetical protein